MDVLITGANGHLGRRLIRALAGRARITAVVRSERAKRRILDSCGAQEELDIRIGDPADAAALGGLMPGVEQVVHLIGTIKATRSNPLAAAHEHPARALADAIAGSEVRRVVYVSILGAGPDSNCEVLRRRAAVESILRAVPGDCNILRVPMVLGENDRATGALRRRAQAARTVVFRGASLEQPIYAGDVVAALVNLLSDQHTAPDITDLAGPESLPRTELIRRAAAALDRPTPHIVSLPFAAGLVFAGVLELLSSAPPVTRDMLRVLDHDDAIDPTAAAAALGLALTPLDEMLGRCLRAKPGSRSAA